MVIEFPMSTLAPTTHTSAAAMPAPAPETVWSDDTDTASERSDDRHVCRNRRRMPFEVWVEDNYDELESAYNALRAHLHDTISTVMNFLTFRHFCSMAYDASFL